MAYPHFSKESYSNFLIYNLIVPVSAIVAALVTTVAFGIIKNITSLPSSVQEQLQKAHKNLKWSIILWVLVILQNKLCIDTLLQVTSFRFDYGNTLWKCSIILSVSMALLLYIIVPVALYAIRNR
jgi:hypothetical protein